MHPIPINELRDSNDPFGIKQRIREESLKNSYSHGNVDDLYLDNVEILDEMIKLQREMRKQKTVADVKKFELKIATLQSQVNANYKKIQTYYRSR